MHKKSISVFAFLLLGSNLAFAQSGVAVKQSGNITPNQVPWWITSGVIGGGVSAADSPISSFGTTGPICSNSARQASGAWNALCFQANTNSAATISLQNYGSAPPQSLVFVVNGVQYPIPVGPLAPSFPNGIVSGGNNTNYYVATTGSDSNTCLSALLPCLTLQGTWNKIALANYGIGGATMHIADGTYSEGMLINQSWMGGGPISIVGNCANPGNVVVTSATLSGAITVQGPQVVDISCFQVQSTISHGLYAKWGGVIRHSNMQFGTVVDGHMTVSFGGIIVIDGSYSIVGNAVRHIYAHAGAIRTQDNSVVVTLVGTPALTYFSYVVDHGTFFFYGMSFAGTGAATGSQKYIASSSAHIEGATSCTSFPGNVAGQLFDGSYCFGSDVFMPVNLLNGIGTTSTDAFGVVNSTAATSGQQQWSPRIRWTGFGFATGGSTSQQVDWTAENEILSGVTNPCGRWVLSYQVNGGGYASKAAVGCTGFLNVVGGFSVNGASLRTPFAADTAFFVATGGSDSNSCLSGSPCLTLQHAYDVITNTYDQQGYVATINIADGTYTTPLAINGPPVKTGTIAIAGNSGTPGNVVLTTAAASTIACTNANVVLSGFEVRATGGFAGLFANSGCDLSFSNLRFGTTLTGDHMQAGDGGRIHINGSYSIVGSAGYHWHARLGGRIETPSSPAITITTAGTPAFSNAFAGANTAQIYLFPSSVTFAGTGATGIRFLSHNLARIESGGLGITGFPGNAAGVLQNGGQYDDLTAIGVVALFASLPACASTIEGTMASVSDSSTVTWGATITGGSTNHVGAYCDGTNWTVFSK